MASPGLEYMRPDEGQKAPRVRGRIRATCEKQNDELGKLLHSYNLKMLKTKKPIEFDISTPRVSGPLPESRATRAISCKKLPHNRTFVFLAALRHSPLTACHDVVQPRAAGVRREHMTEPQEVPRRDVVVLVPLRVPIVLHADLTKNSGPHIRRGVRLCADRATFHTPKRPTTDPAPSRSLRARRL